MIYKERVESTELLILKSLNNRSELSEKERQYYLNISKGFEGETLFDSMINTIEGESIILNDLLFKQNHTLFQIDSLTILSDTIYMFEIKNYEGDYYYESDRLYKQPKTEITNPLNQLSKSELLLRQLIQGLGYNLSIKAYVIFINPTFTLYQAPLNKPFILPTQLQRFISTLDSKSSKMNQKHRTLANKLLSLHLKDSPFNNLPNYDYDKLKKGITCTACGSLHMITIGQKCICQNCGVQEKVINAVLRSVHEFKLLFPNEKVTTNVIYEWCKIIDSKKRIRYILQNNYKKFGVHQWMYYE
ncbi:nuclease-related domain-containing protein [Metabacillus malikii]|uniref:NERD domain-containing protein n=1 Tax=Metabacillus malikii TaxID=1504265 RepID=A0ABT9ZIM1_9BACI|nr:nuclease-related domain-containing protein [Metabacillus malikii]MDQ0231681.1 hypothetical protein [Metabacillus malikii]